MTTKNIDSLNIILIVVSLFLAFQIPFELFLFSYAVLGPLHYISEINWLNQKSFFIKEKRGVFVFIFFSILITLLMILKLPFLNDFRVKYITNEVVPYLNAIAKFSILSSLLFAVILIFFRKMNQLFFGLILSIVISYFAFKYVPFFTVLVVVFIPTLIHVYVFTFLFMVLGYFKTKNNTGLIALILMVLAPFIIAMSKITPIEYENISQYSKESFIISGIPLVIKSLSNLFQHSTNEQISLLSIESIKIQIFIAFAYTYHYLNWFSKTSIIGWYSNISKRRKIIFLVFWIISITLYLYSYKIGITTLFFLSILHVYFEFPLNIITVREIFRNSKS